MRSAESLKEPWYRNPWVWLIIAIPGLTVIGCIITIYLAITNPEILVAAAGFGDAALVGVIAAAGPA